VHMTGNDKVTGRIDELVADLGLTFGAGCR
jgi:hypothetical protein